MDAEALQGPISGDNPCGESFEDTQELASFDAYRIFGQTSLNPDLDWREIQSRSLEFLGRSKDFRFLTHLAAAVIRTQGVEALVQTLQVAAGWLKDYWPTVYPLIDDDAILRRNALNGFADNMALLDALRRTPLVANRQLGSFSFRDTEMAGGRLPVPEGESAPGEDQIRAALSAAPEAVVKLDGLLEAGQQAVKQICQIMMDQGGGTEAIPDLNTLTGTFAKMRVVLKPHVAAAAASAAAEVADATAGDGAPAARAGSGAGMPQGIGSRDDAVRALDAVLAYFRTHEPSSPVPLLIERAKRLVARDFLEVLAELVPEALVEAKRVGGIRDQ